MLVRWVGAVHYEWEPIVRVAHDGDRLVGLLVVSMIVGISQLPLPRSMGQ